uniref:GAG-pre-integrase domain-containing protein n=1 Tax=Tanacetum cinerariifolium TaxID=118510 RepID=A0A6L2KSW9_TANCI|nr:hypothetical protein [Tanacetum cinerariifolium]
MSTQQDIYAAGSESRPPMLNKENYVLWSSRLLRCETAQEIWLRVQQIMKGLDIGIQEKKAKLFNEWERFTSNLSLTIITKDLHTADYTQLYDFLKYNQKEVDELKAKRLAKIQDPLALMANSKNPYVFSAPHQDQSSFNQNYLQLPMPNLEDITDPTTAMNMALALMAKAFKLNYSTPTNNNQRISSNPRNRQIAQPFMNMEWFNWCSNQNQNGNGNLVAARAEGNVAGQNGNQIRCYNCRGVDLDEIEKVNANCILMANLQQASTLGTQTDSAPVYDTDGSAEYTELLEPITESHQVPQNDNDVISEDTCVEQEQKMALGYQNPFYLKQAQKKQQSLYDGKVLLEKHDPPVVHDSEEILQLAQESRDKMKQMNKEIKPANYTKINHLSRVFVPQTALSRKELYFSNNSKTANVSKSISIPNEDFLDDTTPNVARKFLNEVKSTIVTLQHVVKQRMTIETHNWVSSAHQELHKIHKALELEIERLLKAVVSKDVMNIVQKESVVDTSDLQTELVRTKERFENCIIKKETEYAKLWNDWYKKYTRNPLSQKLENENVELEFQSFKKVSDQKEKTQDTSKNTKFAKQPIVDNSSKIGETNTLSKPVTSNSVSTLQESKGIDNTKTRRPHPRSNTKHERVPSTSKSSRSKNKEAEVEEHHRNLLLYKNNKHISSACNNIQIDSQDVISKVLCATCLKCLISVNHDKCLSNYVNGKNSCGTNQKAKVSVKEIQKKYQPKVSKPKKVGTRKSLATPKPRKPRFLFRWSPTDRLFDHEGKLAASSNSESQNDCSNGDNACTSNAMEPNIKQFPNSTSLLDRNDHVAAILGFGQFCDSDLEVAFRRNACFVKNLEGVDLLKGDHSTNLYTINLHEMAFASPICLMARASSTKSWLWHQRLSHLNFDTINDLDRNDLVAGLPKFKYHKEHLCPSCEQGKSKRASHPPKPVPNSRQRLHLLHMDLCGPMRIASINGKRYVLVIVDDYSRYTWVYFLRSKEEAPEVIIKFLKRITVLL